MIGRRFGNYQTISLIGEGGMGAVYLAEHPGIGRRVAIKVLHARLAQDPQALTRFLNEARAANAIRHPNIIEVLDSGTNENGDPYLVMELLEGETLAARLRRLGWLPIKDAVELTLQTASALGAAHDRGIVHRDIKPDNLFILSGPASPEGDQIKVLDFGIAKLHASFPAPGVKTRTGTAMGTPAYMSPEQCSGNRLVDQRSDIYALGLILYEMLSGQPPFVSKGVGELLHMHISTPPQPIRLARPQVPPALEALIARTLAKAPADRFSSMAELEAALRKVPTGPSETQEIYPGVADTFPASPPEIDVRSPKIAGPPAGTGAKGADTSPRRQRAHLWLLVAGLAAVIGSLALFRDWPRTGPSRSPGPAPTPAASASPPAAPVELPPPRIRIVIETVPPDALVSSIEDGAPLGSTPVIIERSRGPGSVGLRFHKQGYRQATRVVAVDQDRTLRVDLEPDPPRRRRSVKTAPSPADEPAAL